MNISFPDIGRRLPQLPQMPKLPSVPRPPGIPTLLEWYGWRRSLEQLVIFDDDHQRIWRVELARSELIEHFDSRARYVRPDWAPEIMGVLIMLGIGWFLGFTLWYMWIPVPLFDAIMGAGPAFLFAIPGWWIGPLFGPRSHWISRHVNGHLIPLLHGRIPEFVPEHDPDPDATPAMVQQALVEYHRKSMSGVEVLTSEVMYEIMEMRDEKALVTGGLSRWQKIALGGVAALLVSMVVALFFFAAVFTQPGA